MDTLYEILEQQLKCEPNFVEDDGKLKKWVVVDRARNFDEELIGLLLDNKALKDKFFVSIKGTLVFNQSLFIQFLECKNYFNDSYTKFKNKVGLTIGGKHLKQRNEVALVWPFKDCILEGGQSSEEDKREEIFFNETLAQDEITQLLEPKVLTNAKVFDQDGEHAFSGFTRDATLNEKRDLPQDTITDNLIIKGNNLLALHSLKKEFAGKVKLIYIDPPYNTGNDGFKYNDNFNHSTWLTFMKNRLEIARQLLRDDGVIFVQCDDNEQAYLKVLMDEVFGRENFVNTIIVQMSEASGTKMAHVDKRFPKIKEYIHVYRKGVFKVVAIDFIKKSKWDSEYKTILCGFTKADRKKLQNLMDKDRNNHGDVSNANEILSKVTIKPLNDFEDFEDSIEWKQNNAWRIIQTVSSDSLRKIVSDYKKIPNQTIASGVSKDSVLFFYNTKSNLDRQGRIRVVFADNFLSKHPCDLWSDIKTTGIAQEGKVSLRFGKKPEKILYRIIHMLTQPNDIILDYHLGSATTAAVAHKMGRQYIGIEQMDYIETVAMERLKKVIAGEQGGISKSVNWQGGGGFTYLELKRYNQIFVEQIETAKDSKMLLKIWEQMKEKSFLNYNVDIKKQEEHIEEFKGFPLQEQKQHLCELLDKNQLYVNRSSLNDKYFACTDEEKRISNDFYPTQR